jgi:tetratricopeptide (TPR) repeat protein
VKKWIVTILAALVTLTLALTVHQWIPWLLSFATTNKENIEHLNTFAELISKVVTWSATAVLFIFGLWQKKKDDADKPGSSITNSHAGRDLNAAGRDVQTGGTRAEHDVIGRDSIGRDKIGTVIYQTVAATPAPAPTLSPIHQLPPPPADFTGRTAELAELRAAIEKGGVHISGLQGQGGVGKTALALKLAAELAPKYPDAQIYLDLKGASEKPLTAAEAMSHVLRTFHPEAKLPEKEEDLRALYLDVLHNKRALLLMDNAKDASQLNSLIPPDGCMFLVTSRTRFTLPGLYQKHLDTFPSGDATRFLLEIAPRIKGEAETIAKLCGYLALALRLAGTANRRGEGADLNNLGVAYRSLGEYHRAIEYNEQHLTVAREIGDRRGEGAALGNLGAAYGSLGEYHRATEYHEQRLAIAREIGDRQGEGQALGNLGVVYQSLGEYRRAIEYYELDLAITREISDRRGEGTVLWNMSVALDKLGDRKEAIERAEAALRIREEIEDPNAAKVREQLEIWRNA